ncbi:MAG: 1-acyl-sn-glycerol-3-phosphate acyltransferase [Bacteroidota bacterium]
MFRPIFNFFFKRYGWHIEGYIPPDLKKYVIAIAPHTSNWDFILTVAVRSIMRVKSKYLAKRELFRFPMGYFFRLLGGYPVDRSKSGKMVDAVADIFNAKKEFVIALAPEGTRRKVQQIKTGFYYIAKAANVPVVLVGLDYSRKTIVISEPIYSTGEDEKDIEGILDFFRTIKGKHPELGIS